jgi:hypothetical protein
MSNNGLDDVRILITGGARRLGKHMVCVVKFLKNLKMFLFCCR